MTPHLLALKRRLAWDLLPHAESEELAQMFSEVGLIWGSEDVISCEHSESHVRMACAAPLEMQVALLAGLSADVILGAILNERSTMSDETQRAFGRLIEPIVRATSTVALAHLLASGLVELPKQRGFFG